MSEPQILVIEDDPTVAQSLQVGQLREGFEVALKSNDQDGISYVQKIIPHLVQLDIRLPDDSSFDVYRKLRQMGFHFPIIILTAREEILDKVLGLETGANDYVTKPYDPRELVSRIRAQLRRAYGELSTCEVNHLLVDDLVIDPSSRRALRHGDMLNLTLIEFRLLAFLARHRGQVLSRSQIVETIWGHSPDPDSEESINVQRTLPYSFNLLRY